MLEALPYLQTLTFVSPETCTLFRDMVISDAVIEKFEDLLERAEFM